jgi:hypothetical protein
MEIDIGCSDTNAVETIALVPDLKSYLGGPDHKAFAEQRRVEREAAAKAKREKREAAQAEEQVRKDREAVRARERKKAIKIKEKLKARQRRGKKAMMHVARWAFDRAYSERSVFWRDRRNWIDRLVRLVTKQAHNHIADRVGSDALVKRDDAFYEEAARLIFRYYRKTGHGPPESELQKEVAFPLVV